MQKNPLNLENLPIYKEKIFLTLGTFDGMHLGHQKIIKKTGEFARQNQGLSAVFTFNQNPASVFEKEESYQLTSPQQKFSQLLAYGIDIIVMQDFTLEFSHYSPEKFLDILLSHFSQLKTIFVGENWRFGYQGRGDIHLLQKLSTSYSYDVCVFPILEKNSNKISSTLIRKLIYLGKFKEAEEYLGHPFIFSAKVQKGSGRGKSLGFATLNLPVERSFFPQGVWGVQVFVRERWYRGVANFGCRPTFGDSGKSILEVHLFDFSHQIYEEEILVRFCFFLREERCFSSSQALAKQITEDSSKAEEKLAFFEFPACNESILC